MKINEYRIKDNVNKELLEEIGFTEYVPNHLYYRILLYRAVTLNITIPFINDKIDLNNLKIRVLCEEDLQPYIPFYQVNEYPNNEFLENVILRYNHEMDELVKKGVFEKVNKNEYFSFIEKYQDLIDETIEKRTLSDSESGNVPRRINLEELVDKEDEFLENYCLDEDDSKRLRLIRESRRK